MRFAVAVMASAIVLAGGVRAARASDAAAQAGFTISIPDGWTERTTVEQATVDGFHRSDPGDADVAFAWSSADNGVVTIVQAMTSAKQVPQGSFRSNGVAMHNAIIESLGMTDAKSSESDDGTVVTGQAEGDLNTLHLIVFNQAMVDSARHLRGYSAVCAIRLPVTDAGRSTCDAVLHSFKVTLDPSTILPLESK
jgi:hypothetical protein